MAGCSDIHGTLSIANHLAFEIVEEAEVEEAAPSGGGAKLKELG